MIRFIMRNLMGACPQPLHNKERECFLRSEELATQVSRAVCFANVRSSDRLPAQYREYYRLGSMQRNANNPKGARRTFKKALEFLPLSTEFDKKRAFIEYEISQLPHTTPVWKRIVCAAVPIAIVVASAVEKNKQ